MGEYSVGQRIPTEAELSSHFQTSRAVVRRAMRKLTNDGLLLRRQGSGSYVRQQPSTVNRQLAIISQYSKGNLSIISDALAHEAHSNGFGFLLGMFSEEDMYEPLIKRAEEFCRQYLERKVSGIFFIPMYLPDEHAPINVRIADMFDQVGIPVVLMDRDIYNYPKRSKYDLVGIDNPDTGLTVTEHLLSLGYRRIEFITYGSYQNTSTITGRIIGYREAMQNHNIVPQDDWVHIGDPTDIDFIRDVMQNSKAEAFLCANDYVAAHLMRNLWSLKIRVPEDLAVVGIDDDEWGKFLPASLTTMRQPCTELGKTAIDIMLKRLKNPDMQTCQISLKCDLVVRESCGALLRQQSTAKVG